MSEEILAAAMTWADSGASVLPAAGDATKRPGLSEWRRYQVERPSNNQLRDWFVRPQARGLGVVCGAVSGALEMVELERRAMDAGLLERIAELCEAAGLSALWVRIVKGYAEASPSGGMHLFWRITDGPVPGNTKLARRLATADELAEGPDRYRVLIETRGEGGWVVTAPSNGTTHPSGRPWVALHGSPRTIARISRAERERIIRVLETFDDVPTAAPGAPDPQPARTAGEQMRPGDDFNDRARWEDILVGWRKLYTRGGTSYWRRPGKTDPGLSATTGRARDADRLYVFSSATEFEPEKPYTKFGAWALLHHGGDHAAAASELRKLGYGAARDDGKAAREQQEMIAALIGDAQLSRFVDGDQAIETTPETTSTAVMGEQLTEEATEQEVADWIVANYRDRLFYVGSQKRFYYWTGALWAPQDDCGLQFQVVRAGCDAVPGTRRRQKWGSHSTSMNVKCKLERHPGLRVDKHDLDPHPHLLNTPAGIVDLRTGEIGPHDPAMMCTRITRTGPDPAVRCERFERFITEIFPASQELRRFVQVLLGYCLLGLNKEQLFIIAHGLGRNGKSLLLDTIMWLLGSYADKGDSDWLMVRHNGPHTEEVAAIEGNRLMYFSEIGDRNQLDERRIKELSGGEYVASRKLYQGFESFKNTCTMVLIANELPKIGQGGNSLWRRIRAIPFAREFTEAEQDVDLPELFVQPRSATAIMNWLIDGAVSYYRDGLRTPAEVSQAGEQFRHEAAGPLADYVEDRLVLGGGQAIQTTKAALYEDYKRWCLINGQIPISQQKLARRLKDSFNLEDDRSKAARYWIGVSLGE